MKHLLSVVVALLACQAVRAEVSVTVNFGEKAGVVRRINGINHGPLTSGRAIDKNIAEFKALNVASVRLHDAPLFSHAMRLVDIPMIFPVWNRKADPADPDNYFFDATDDYLRILRDECGVRSVIYRLGASIEHCKPRRYFAKRPDDFARYAEICAGVVRHYTKAAWANGFDAGVTHWEIWNEPNNVPEMWDRDYGTFLEMYVCVAKRLRAEFTTIRIGGPANGCSKPDDRLERLVAACKKANAPLDFYSEHGYSGTPEQHAARMARYRKILDAAGFAKTEIHFNEWHYFPCRWSDLTTAEGQQRWFTSPDGINGIDAAAHAVRALIVWQDSVIDMANFYSTVGTGWGVYDVYGVKRPTYHALRLFGDFIAAARDRVRASSSDGRLAVLAGVSGDGKVGAVIASCRDSKKGERVTLDIRGAGAADTASVEILDGMASPRTVTLPIEGGRIQLPPVQGASVWLIRLSCVR